MTVAFYILPSRYSSFSTSLLALGVITIFYFSDFDSCVVISRNLNLHFPGGLIMLNIFHELICHLYILSSEMSVVSFTLFLIRLFFIVEFSEFFILDNNPLSDTVCKYFLSLCSLSFHNLHMVIFRV